MVATRFAYLAIQLIWVDCNRRDSIGILHSLYLNENGPISNKAVYFLDVQGQYFALISHANTVLCYHSTSVHAKWIESYCLIRDLNIIHSKRTDSSFFKLNLTHNLDFIVKGINMCQALQFVRNRCMSLFDVISFRIAFMHQLISISAYSTVKFTGFKLD